MARGFNPQYIDGDFDPAVVAAGTTQATATTATAEHMMVTSGTGGVVLVESSAGANKSVANNTAVNIIVYPWSGAQINGATANLGVVLAPQKAAWFKCHTPTKITAIY